MKSNLDRLISEIKDSILPQSEEVRLILIFKNQEEGWEEAQEKIIKSNLLYVVKVAFEFTTEEVKVLELISEGCLSLLDSLIKFDPSKGCKFLTYASLDLRGRMLKHLAKNNAFSSLKISQKNIELAKKARIYIENYTSENGKKPNLSQIAEHCEIDEGRALLIVDLADCKIFSIQSTILHDDEEKLAEVKDENVVLPNENVARFEISSILHKIVANLPLRQQLVINKRFGLNGENVTDLASIGNELNLTKERIRQIEQSVLKVIRKEIEKISNEFNKY